MHVVPGLDEWFTERLKSLHSSYRPETIAYVTGVLKAQANPRFGADLSDRSVVLEYAIAIETGDFESFQRIGDWVLWVDIVLPQSIVASKDAIESIGRRSYMSCHHIMRGKWQVYEELADVLPSLAMHVRHKIVDRALARDIY